MSAFPKAVSYILDEENGYSNDPQDSGKETNYGISKKAFPAEDIKNIKIERAIQLYRDYYWIPIRGDELPLGVSLLVFDCAVNQGVDTAIRLLQEACGAVVDGQLGPKTMGRVNSIHDADLLGRYAALRALRYTKTKSFDVFGNGWFNRLCRQTVRAAEMIV